MWVGCGTARRWIQKAIDGDLSGRRGQRLERHLDGCAGCREERRRLFRVVSLVSALRDRGPEVALGPAVLRRIRAARREMPRAPRVLGFWQPVLVAAAAAVVAVLAWDGWVGPALHWSVGQGALLASSAIRFGGPVVTLVDATAAVLRAVGAGIWVWMQGAIGNLLPAYVLVFALTLMAALAARGRWHAGAVRTLCV